MPETLGTTEWAREHRRLNAKATARPGRYNPDLTPWVHGIHDALDDPAVFKVVAVKSAQIAWTDGVLLNYLGRRIDIDPCAMIVMFAKDQAAREFNDEKFVPMVEATPRLAQKIPVHKMRDRDNRSNFKAFPGGFLKFVSSNSPSSVKSTPAPVVCVEEPDDANTNVRDQGDTITLLEERTKTFVQRKVIFGGTPTIKGLSRIDAAYAASDQRKFFVPCHHCGESHVLAWENVTWLSDSTRPAHEVFGHQCPETASYACPHCGALWNDREKNRNVKQGQWRATAPFYGTAGFYVNELYSPFPGSTLSKLVEKYLAAQDALSKGDDTKMRSFVNNTEGRAYEYASGLPDAEKLQARAVEYEEFTVPWGGIVLTVGCDVQHDRLAVVIRAWGRGEESWLVYWGELYGPTMTLYALGPDGKPHLQGAWVELDALLTRTFTHASGAALRISAVSIDSSDGQTSDAVYGYVRTRQARGYKAVKGDSHDPDCKKEIFSPPKTSIDTDRKNKAHKFGVTPYIVGTGRAKDLILGADEKAGRVKLVGSGPGRMHIYKGVRPDYWSQLLSEVKAPSKTHRHKRTWQAKSGTRNEALDCEVMALHAARSLKLNLWKEDRWAKEEREQIRQSDMIAALAELPPVEPLPDLEPNASAPEPPTSAPPLAEPQQERLPSKPVLPSRKKSSFVRRYGGYP